MKTAHYYETAPIPELYRWFAREAAPTSPIWQRVCLHVAASEDVCARLSTLPGMKRQPNLFLAALKYLGAPYEPDALPDYLAGHWEEIEHLILSRRTQTNEVGRCAVLAPVLASLPQPIALVEVGMSAGACLALDRYGYSWTSPSGELLAHHRAGDGVDVALTCSVTGHGLPLAVPTVAWRAGIDLLPLDPSDPDTARWLRALVWPGEEEREQRLSAALHTVAAVPMLKVAGDATDALAEVVAQAPPDATVVVMHSAVLAYLSEEARERHVRTLADLGVHWIANEGPRVVPGVRDRVQVLPTEGRPHFVLSLDGVPLARAGSHGAWLDWLEDPSSDASRVAV